MGTHDIKRRGNVQKTRSRLLRHFICSGDAGNAGARLMVTDARHLALRARYPGETYMRRTRHQDSSILDSF